MEGNDDYIIGVKAGLTSRAVAIICPSNDGSNVNRFYKFWGKDGFVMGGYCRLAANGYYQESPQTKQWIRRLPKLVEMVELNVSTNSKR